MKFLQILFIFGVIEVSLQQSIRCYQCTNCGADRSQWGRIVCDTGDEDDNTGPPTTPASPLGFSAKNISIDEVFVTPGNFTNVTVSPVIDTMTENFQCFITIVNVHGNHLTNRGCAVRRQNNQATCDGIPGNDEIINCFLCDNNDFCNSGSGQLVYSLFLVAAFYAIWNILS